MDPEPRTAHPRVMAIYPLVVICSRACVRRRRPHGHPVRAVPKAKSCGSASRRTTIRPVEIPEVRYAKTPDGTHIAFQVFGQGPRDLVYVPGFISNLLL